MPQTRFQRVEWRHGHSDEPEVLWAEVDADGWEVRKVAQFADGRLVWADATTNDSHQTRLSESRLPDLATVAVGSGFSAEVIAQDEFELTWHRARKAASGGDSSFTTPDAAETAVALTVSLLVNREYEILQAMTRGVRLSAEEMEAAIARYGSPLVPIPVTALLPLDVIEIEQPGPQQLYVDVNLWTEAEAPSDLYLTLRLTDRYQGAYDIEIEDIRVH